MMSASGESLHGHPVHAVCYEAFLPTSWHLMHQRPLASMAWWAMAELNSLVG